MAPAHSTLFEFLRGVQRIALLFLFTFLLAPVVAQNRSAEVGALSLLRLNVLTALLTAQTNYDNFELGGFWSTWNTDDENACSWVGVTCTTNFTVEELDLSGWGYTVPTQTLPWSFSILSALKDLRKLDLSYGGFPYQLLVGDSAAMPGNIEALPVGLTHLDLSGNGITGNIPVNISACRNLRVLSLEQNMLDGPIPSLRGLQNLQILLLGGNNLAGAFPRELGELSSVVSIDLSHNRLNGTIPSLVNMTNVRKLKFDNNYFTGFEEPVLPNTRSLEHLDVSGNQMGGLIPPVLANMKHIEYLNMSSNRLSGQVPFGLHSAWLDLSFNQLTGKLPADFLYPFSGGSGVRPICWLNVSHNLLNGSIPIPSGNQSRPFYFYLDLSHNQLIGNISSIMNDKFTIISTLQVENNSLSGDIVDVLVNLKTSVVDMRLGNNLFSGDIARLALENWTQDSTFGASKNLETLDLSNNNLQMKKSAANPDPLRALLESCPTQLKELRLGGNNLSGISLPTSISWAFLNDGDPLGNFPPWVSLEVLDLSNSHLDGEIFSAVFNSTSFPYLEILNLSKNDVAGSIPEEIIQLPNLAILDLANNNLSGRIPLIQHSSSLYNASFFAGNGGLCGDPLLEKPCPSNSSNTVVMTRRAGILWWVLLIIIGGSVMIAGGTCLIAAWRWRVYHKRHQQDSDLIQTLLDRESATLMSLRELKKATNDFARSAQIGEGGFGTVYKGTLNNGTLVAIKRSKHEGSKKDKEVFLNEVRILCQVNHRFLVKLLGCCMENEGVALLVFEFVPNGTLKQRLRGDLGATRLSWKQRLSIAVQTAEALNYLHTAATFPIYHRDVKSPNILLDDELNAKVADFGISKLAPSQATHISTVADGTPGYIDPEYYASYRLTDKSDVYSFGVVLLELISAKAAIDLGRGEEELSLVNHAIPHIKRRDLQQLIDPALDDTYNDTVGHGQESILNVASLALKCLDLRSKCRPSMNEVWTELQNLQLEVNGEYRPVEPANEGDLKEFHDTIMHLDSMIEATNRSPQPDQIVSGSEKFFNTSIPDRFTMESDDDSFIELSQFAR